MTNWLKDRRSDSRAASVPEYATRLLPPAPHAVARGLPCIDVEASSLFPNSYPIEVGWAFGDLSGESFLVKPAHGWNGWDWRAEEVHGIKRAEAEARGLPVREAAWRLNRALGGMDVLCDTVGPDGTGGTDHGWLLRLFCAARATMGFRLVPISRALAHADREGDSEADGPAGTRGDEARRLARAWYPKTHKAGEDAMSMAAEVALGSDDTFLDAVRTHDRERRAAVASLAAA